MTLGEVQRVLQQLLREQVSIRDLGSILEVVVETAPVNKNMVHLVETIRQSMGRSLVQPLLDAEGTLRVFVLEPVLEEEMVATLDRRERAAYAGRWRSAGARRRHLPASHCRVFEATNRRRCPLRLLPVLLCSSPARYYLRRWLEPILPRVTVLAPAEIPADIRVRSLGIIRGGEVRMNEVRSMDGQGNEARMNEARISDARTNEARVRAVQPAKPKGT